MTALAYDGLLEVSRWLWDYLLLATVLLIVVLLVGKLIAQPAHRMAVHWSVAIGLFLLALLCAVPDWSVVHMLSAPSEPAPVVTENLEPVVLTAIQIVESDSQPIPAPPKAFSPIPIGEPVTRAKSQTTVEIDFGILSLATASAGSLVVLFWLALGCWQVRRLRSLAKPAPQELATLLTNLANEARVPELGIVSSLPVAAAVGLRRPMVLLPESFVAHAAPEKLRTVLAHELAHIRHRDLWLLALLRGLLLMLWLHPLYWLWRRNVRLDQETLADAAATDVTNRADYAEQLVAWARVASKSRTPRLASSVGLWESPSQLKRRIAILLDDRLTVLRSCSLQWRLTCIAAVTCAALSLSLVTLQPATEAADTFFANTSTKRRQGNRRRPSRNS